MQLNTRTFPVIVRKVQMACYMQKKKKHTLRVIARKGQMACYTDANKHTYIPCQCEKRTDGRLDADKHTYIPPQRELIT